MTVLTRVLSSLRTCKQTQIKTVETTKQKVLRPVNRQVCAVMRASQRGSPRGFWKKVKKMEARRREGGT